MYLELLIIVMLQWWRLFVCMILTSDQIIKYAQNVFLIQLSVR